jgi:hypothetical protein
MAFWYASSCNLLALNHVTGGEMANKKIPYFGIYATDFLAIKSKLIPQDLFEIVNSLSEICVFGESDFVPKSKYQKLYFDQLKEGFERQQKKYIASVENGNKGGRPSLNETQSITNQADANNPDDNPTTNPTDNPNQTKGITIQTKPNQIQTILDTNQIQNTLTRKKDFCADLKTPSAEWTSIFSDWLEYKRERRQSYKTIKTAQTAFDRLLKISNSNPADAREIINISRANNWSGFFPLKNNFSKPTKSDAALTAAANVLQKIEKGEV